MRKKCGERRNELNLTRKYFIPKVISKIVIIFLVYYFMGNFSAILCDSSSESKGLKNTAFS